MSLSRYASREESGEAEERCTPLIIILAYFDARMSSSRMTSLATVDNGVAAAVEVRVGAVAVAAADMDGEKVRKEATKANRATN